MCVCSGYVVVCTRRVQVQIYARMCIQLTTNSIDNLIRLIHTLLHVMTMHAYILL